MQIILWNELEIKILGRISGNIYKAIYENKEVAIKVFKGDMTSDGFTPRRDGYKFSMGVHENLIDVFSIKYQIIPKIKNVLMLEPSILQT